MYLLKYTKKTGRTSNNNKEIRPVSVMEGVDTLDATLLRSRNTVKSKKINFASPLLRSVPLIHERTLAKLSQG